MTPRRRTLDRSIPAEAAKAASLRHAADDGPGITRHRSGKGFSYRTAGGEPIRDRVTLERIRSLVIPPAWTDVWISPHDNGHIQATGRDTRGRKQYRYHPRWREVRDENKYDRMSAFGAALPAIRAAVETDLARGGLPIERALATVVWLLETSFIRIGNREYARTNDSFGLTTMLDRHVQVTGSQIRFRFHGKSGKEHTITVSDRRIARLVKACRDLPGQTLFQYLDDDDQIRAIDAGDVNDYLRRIGGEGFTAKDFRTWGGTLLAAAHLAAGDEAADERPVPAEVIREVAGVLGNTPAVCRKCYIHPAVLQALTDTGARTRWRELLKQARAGHGMSREERALLRFLEPDTVSISPAATPRPASGAAA